MAVSKSFQKIAEGRFGESSSRVKRLAIRGCPDHRQVMGLPDQPVTLEPFQIDQLNQRLSTVRHNVNNHLSLVVAAVELIRRKPEMAQRMIDTLGEQPQKIIDELKGFSLDFERTLGIGKQ